MVDTCVICGQPVPEGTQVCPICIEKSQTAKADAGKLELDLVPLQIIEDIAEVRMYGNRKYGDPDNWKNVKLRRYINALFRHFIAFLRDPDGVDKESGILHYKHMCCNMAFICEMMAWRKNGTGDSGGKHKESD